MNIHSTYIMPTHWYRDTRWSGLNLLAWRLSWIVGVGRGSDCDYCMLCIIIVYRGRLLGCCVVNGGKDSFRWILYIFSSSLFLCCGQ